MLSRVGWPACNFNLDDGCDSDAFDGCRQRIAEHRGDGPTHFHHSPTHFHNDPTHFHHGPTAV